MAARMTAHVVRRERGMARKKCKPKAAKAKGRNVESKSSHEAILQAKTSVALAPSYNAGGIVTAFTSATVGEVDLMAAGKEIANRCAHVIENMTGRMEEMLMAQAHSLDVMFASLSRRAATNMGQGEGRLLNAADMYMKLALRAQNQCRMTLETLATIKNPPVVFAKQANIAHGHQQVNNGEAIPVARTSEKSNRPNKLLERPNAKPEWMDAGAAAAAIPSDPGMATLESIDGPKDGAG